MLQESINGDFFGGKYRIEATEYSYKNDGFMFGGLTGTYRNKIKLTNPKTKKEGEYFYASLSDEAKLCHSEEYKRGLDILKAKGVKTYTVEERIKQIKEMGYEIKEL